MTTVKDRTSGLTLEDLRRGERATLTIPEVAPILGISPGAAYVAAQRSEIPVLRIGRRMVVPVPALLRFLDGEPIEVDPASLGRR